jgi:hypothetical protein
MNFLETFLKLTEYTIPFGNEDLIIPFIKERVPNLTKDVVGNYYTVIGKSETLFTTHLDTYSTKRQLVNHIIDGEWVKTDGETILGGDNKNGTTILLYMIENNIPGTYYFFIGEEPITSGGLYGSRNILRKNPEFFKKFKRAIAFDRKETSSIVIRQLARKCCSDEFSSFLVDEFTREGVPLRKDPKAYYTDTASFLDVIPEITNISAGGWGEHTLKEKTMISFVERIAKAAIKIKWEDSPVVREAKPVSTRVGKKIDIYYKISKSTFDKIDYLLSDVFGYKCLNLQEFGTNVDMIFSHWHKDSEFNVKINKNDIYIGGELVGDFKRFKSIHNLELENMIDPDVLIDNIVDHFQSWMINIKDLSKYIEREFIFIDIDDLKDYTKRNKQLEIKGNKFIVKT